MTVQLALPLDRRPKVDGESVEMLIRVLRGRGWVTAKRLCTWLSMTDRMVRALAEASAGRVISGQLGYKLTADASEEERHHAAAWLRSQARRMNERADQIEEAA